MVPESVAPVTCASIGIGMRAATASITKAAKRAMMRRNSRPAMTHLLRSLAVLALCPERHGVHPTKCECRYRFVLYSSVDFNLAESDPAARQRASPPGLPRGNGMAACSLGEWEKRRMMSCEMNLPGSEVALPNGRK